MSQERTRFPITPQERHRTAASFDDVAAMPEDNRPRREERPQDKPAPPQRRAARDTEDKPAPPQRGDANDTEDDPDSSRAD